MSLPALTARVRTVWESLAGVPVGFAPVLRVAASPRSGLCPPSWVGLVVIAGTAIATAPDARTAQIVQQALGTVATASLTEPAVLSGELVIADMLGPATLAYFDGTVFHPPPGPATTEAVDASDPALGQFLSAADTGDLGESGLVEITSPAFVICEQGRIVAAAGYRDWPGRVAHLSVLTAAQARGRGLGSAVASAAVAHALGENKLPQWRARSQASRRIARRLGFHELGSQVSIRLASDTPSERASSHGPGHV
jgi:GNAT superfamily N-acetyltransferase